MSFGMLYDKSVNGERYVYYKRLNTDTSNNKDLQDQWRNLYEKTTALMDYRIEQGSDSDRIASYFMKLRDSEYKKEIKLLRSKFGEDFMKDYKYGNDSFSETQGISEKLIKGYNELLNLKKVFKRNFQVITKTNQTQVISHFDTYFESQYDKNADKIIAEIEQLLPNRGRDTIKSVIDSVMGKWIPILTREALKASFQAGVEDKRVSKDLQDAYAELIPILDDINNEMGNEFVRSFIKDYQLDKISNAINERRKTIYHTKEGWKGAIKNFGILENWTSKGSKGYASESLQTLIGQFLDNAVRTGPTNQKADMIVTYNIPSGDKIVKEWMKENVFGTRPADIDALKKLQGKLEDFNDSFIVYSNTKNYSLGKTFTQGFRGGEINLDTWDTMMHRVGEPKKGRILIFMALQLIPGKGDNPGAIGEGKDEEVKKAFARAIASALFDDFDIIGEEQGNLTSIHLMYLNGIYIPLSFYFNLLYKAFKDYSKENIDKLITVKIDHPEEIEYPTMKDQEGVEHPWNVQSKIALNQTRISYFFLKNFKEEMQKLNVKFLF